MPDPRSAAEFEAFYLAYGLRVRRLSARLVGDADADDVTQEVMLRAARHLAGQGFSGEPWPWLEIVTRRLAVDHYRRTGRVEPADGDTLTELAGISDDDPSEAAVRADLRHRLSRALHRLPPADRAMLIRHEVDGATVASMAVPLGMTANALRQRLFRARRTLAHHYEQLGGVGVGSRGLAVVAPLRDAIAAARRRVVGHWPARLSWVPDGAPVRFFDGRGRSVAAAAMLLSTAPFTTHSPPHVDTPAIIHSPREPEGLVPAVTKAVRDLHGRLPRPSVALPGMPGPGPAEPDPTRTLRWTRRVVAAPPDRYQAAMAYDETRRETVLFGGASGDGAFADTWTWDGAAWTRRQPATAPPARYGAAMVFDAARGEIVLFGGYVEGTGYSSDTWTWDGTTWTQRFPPTSPTPRSQASLAFDPVRGQVLLFAGTVPVGHTSDTWTWDGTTWTKRVIPAEPSTRFRAQTVFDPARQQIVLHGGHDQWPLNDTWTWDGTAWTELVPDIVPETPRWHVSVVYDRRTGRLVAANGPGAWLWTGTDWRATTSVAGPDLRPDAAVAYDSARATLVFFGGGANDVAHGDTWTASFDAVPAPVVGDVVAPVSAVNPLTAASVTGTASDEGSGVTTVRVTFTPVVGSGDVVVMARVTCADDRRARCTWVAPGPGRTGGYSVTVVATDAAGNEAASVPAGVFVEDPVDGSPF